MQAFYIHFKTFIGKSAYLCMKSDAEKVISILESEPSGMPYPHFDYIFVLIENDYTMKITFQIHYRTVWGEELKVVLPHNLVSLNTSDGYLWTGSIEILPQNQAIPYYYCVFANGVCKHTEWNTILHFLNLPTTHNCCICDNWRDIPLDSCLYTSAFTHEQGFITTMPDIDKEQFFLFRATCPMLPSSDYQLKIIGNQEALGNWQTDKAVLMYQVSPHQWMGAVSSKNINVPFEYKFIATSNNQEPLFWSTGGNKQWQRMPTAQEGLVLPDVEAHFEQPNFRLAGTAIPIFSLRSNNSFGVGDFGDLKQMIDWASLTHQKVVQILPINDTTSTYKWTDSYPYNSISIYALHPIYMDLKQLGCLSDCSKQQRFNQIQSELNTLPDVDYEQVIQAKIEFIRLKYQEEGEYVLQSPDFRSFFRKNQEWLQPYAAYCYLRDKSGTPDYTRWESYSTYQKEEIENLCNEKNPAYKDIAFFYFTQYHLHKQLLEAGNHARKKGIILKGDIPIGVNRCGVDAWTEPHYFNLNGQAGAPPDPFSDKGQNWGFPTYNWERMEQDNYLWWQRRFTKMAEYFTAYRIDHILGFFRIWEIPSHAVHGLLGQFVPSLPLSPQEIESFGMPFDEHFHTIPYIDNTLLYQTFGENAEWIKEHFLYSCDENKYQMKPEFATQRQIQKWFKGKDDEHNKQLCEGLYSLISNVLFLPDRNQPNRFHPRIMAQKSYFYSTLKRNEKAAFDRLHQHYFYERHNEFWYHEAMKKLPILTQCTSMLACGEDLGMIPACVPWVMNALHILSLEIERMPKEPGYTFAHTEKYPYHSVCTLSTHDMSTLRGWWKENSTLTDEYYHQVMNRTGNAPTDADATTCETILARQLASPSLLCVLSWQDWLSIDQTLRCSDIERERINIPANPLNYWHYRMHLTLEELMNADELNAHIRRLIQESGRK